MSYLDSLKSKYVPVKNISLEEKIKILELSDQRVQELKNMPVKIIPYNPSAKFINALEMISADNIVGLARGFWDNNWLDVLSERYCHKVNNFLRYDKNTFDEVLRYEQADGYPVVIEHQNEYYISGNGLHRLTIAKCLGNKKVLAIVKRLDGQKM